MSDRIDEAYIEWLEKQIEEWDGQPPPDGLPDDYPDELNHLFPDFEMDPQEGDEDYEK